MMKEIKQARADRNFVARAIDSVIETFSPSMAMDRLKNRTMLTSYIGASKSRNSMRTWSPGSVSPNQANLDDRDTLIERANDLDRNNDIAGGARLKCLTSVIGKGLNHKSKIDPVALGATQAEADKFEAIIEKVWADWAGSIFATSEMDGNFHKLVRIAYSDTFIDGDVLFVERYLPIRGVRANALLGTCYQLVRGDRICNNNFSADTQEKVAGINIDKNGAVVSYDVLDGDPGEARDYGKSYKWKTIKAFSPSGEIRARLIFNKERTGMYRGVPRLSRVIEDLKQIEDYGSNVAASSVLFSLFTAFIETQQGTGLSTDNESLENAVSGKKDDEVAMGAGSFVNLLPGESVKMAQSAKNNQEFDVFFSTYMKKVGMAVNIPYQVLIQHYNSSYSSARAEIQSAYENFRLEAHDFGTSMYKPAFEAVILEAHARRIIDLPGILEDKEKRSAYLKSEFYGHSTPQIDPLRAVKASILRIDAGFSTGERESSETNGSDYMENLRTIAQEQKAAEVLHIPDRRQAALEDEANIDEGGQS